MTCVALTMLDELFKRIQHCCATLRRSRNKINVGSCWLKSLTGFKLCATTRNNMQQGVQTDATCNFQHCWQLLANNVASVCTGLHRVFSFTWPASMQIYWNKRKGLHKKRVQLPKDWFGTPTWPLFHCFGTPIWRP